MSFGGQALMMPYSIPRDDAVAIFFIRLRTNFGVSFKAVPAEASQKIGKNGGVLAAVVVRGSPAYNADIIEGDVLWSIDGARLDTTTFLDTVRAKHGASVDIELGTVPVVVEN